MGIADYARYCDDYREQTQLRDMLKDKPDEIIEYERRLKAATFAYNKADSKSQKGHRSAKKMFGASDTLFERLSEYLTEKIVGHHDLEIWFDRPLATGAISVFDTYDEILEKCAQAWNFFANDPQRITSITKRDWIKVNY